MASASLELSALRPSVSAMSGAPSLRQSFDWALDWKVIARTGSIALWAWLVGYLGFSLLWVVGVSLLLVFSIVRQRKHVQFHQTLKFQKVTATTQRYATLPTCALSPPSLPLTSPVSYVECV